MKSLTEYIIESNKEELEINVTYHFKANQYDVDMQDYISDNVEKEFQYFGQYLIDNTQNDEYDSIKFDGYYDGKKYYVTGVSIYIYNRHDYNNELKKLNKKEIVQLFKSAKEQSKLKYIINKVK